VVCPDEEKTADPTSNSMRWFSLLLALYLTFCISVAAFQLPSNSISRSRKEIRPVFIRRKTVNTIISREQSLFGAVDDIISQASTAAETWTIESTIFLEPDVASQVETQLQDRGDVLAFRVVGGRRLTPSSDDISKGEGRRSRFVFVHPDLGLDAATAEAEYCTVILVENVNLKASNSIPNALAGIGVDLDQVGDIVVSDESTVHLVVDPLVAKQCIRLLSKELVGVGISLSVVDAHEFMPDGQIQEMKLSRILERKMDRKKYEKGYVHLS
jgi:RNA-binding protein YlmH